MMKKSTLFRWFMITAFCSFYLGMSSYAEKVTYQDTWNNPGLSLQRQDAQGVTLNFSIGEFDISTRSFNGKMMQELSLEGNFLPNNEGAPNLPVISRYIALPQGAQAILEIKRQRTEVMGNVEMVPAPHIPLDTERGPLQYNKDLSIYSSNAYYPQQPVTISQPMQIRGVDVVLVSITPYQYNPVTKQLVVIRDIEVDVNFVGGNGHFGDDRLRSRFWDPILQDNIFNSASLPEIDYCTRLTNLVKERATGCEYLIIVPNDPVFRQWADTIRKFRTEQGILTNVVSLQEIGGNTTTIIENYINNAYTTWTIPPAAFLIMADYGTSATNQITSPIWNSYCVSDNIYADVNNDNLPDIAHARMTAQNASHLQIMVEKFIGYETNPPTDPNFYKYPVTALGWQTERWFQICSEVVGGFWKNQLGKTPVRINAIYDGTPGTVWSTATNTNTVVNYFGPSGLGYIPLTPIELGGWTGGTAAQVNAALNAGAFMLQHRDHGYEQGWGEPSYSSSNISSLTNVGKLSYIMSVNCLTGKYNYSSEVFAEKFHRYTYNNQYAGAVGILAASETSYSFVNDAFVWGMYDNLWPNFMPSYGAMFSERDIRPAFGMCAGKYFLQQSSWPYNTGDKTVTYHLFHHHGDAFLDVYSEVPQQLTVNHNAVMLNGLSTFEVTANPGAFIALTFNGQIIGTGVGTGSPLAIPVNTPPIGSVVKIVVTKQNYFRHVSSVIVISPQYPYVVTNAVSINDPNGNNNHILDYGETGSLSVTMENLGNTNSDNTVTTISSDDSYVTITDATENYGTIPAHSSVTVPDGFQLTVANNIPDGHQVEFTATATDGTDTWVSHFRLTCNAPVLASGATMYVDDSQGGNNNHRLDAGETANIIISTANNGHSTAVGAVATLSCNNAWVTINNSSSVLGNIDPSGTQTATFNVTVHPNAPSGLLLLLTYNVQAGAYTDSHVYNTQIGMIVEDWETGDFTKFSWSNTSAQPWTITNVGPYEGVYSAKSGAISDLQTTSLSLVYNVPANDTIRFTYKVSSEATKDKLRFYINSTVKGDYSGTSGWETVKFPVSAGTQTFKWIYSKDGSGSAGDDCAWLDYIVLPVAPTTACMAGFDGYSCQGAPYQCNGAAANYNTIVWETSGSGTFSSTSVVNPIYTPSAGDILDGSVVLTMAATGITGTSVDNMLLSFVDPAIVSAGLNASACEGTQYVHSGASASNYNSLEWTTTGTGTFVDSHVLNPVYIPSTADATAGSVTLTLSATSFGCGPVTSSINLTVNPLPQPAVSGEAVVCQESQNVIYSTPLVSGHTYSWTVTGGVMSQGTNPNEIAVAWNNAGNGTVAVTETSQFSCSSSTMKDVLVKAAPQPVITGNNLLCSGETVTYSTQLNNDHSYVWDAGGASIVSGQNTNEVQILFETAGTFNVSVTETDNNNQCGKTVVSPVTVNTSPAVPGGPQGENRADLYYISTSDYTVTAVPFAITYTWKLSPADAGTISGTGNTATVTWNSSYRGTAEVSVKVGNNCGESAWSPVKSVEVLNSTGLLEQGKVLGVNITPNPNDGKFTLTVSTPGIVTFGYRIINANGSVIVENKGLISNGKYSEQLDTHLAAGVYSIVVNTAAGQAVERFVVK